MDDNSALAVPGHGDVRFGAFLDGLLDQLEHCLRSGSASIYVASEVCRVVDLQETWSAHSVV